MQNSDVLAGYKPDISHIITESDEIDNDALDGYEPDISHIITEDDEPVDNLFSEHQQRLLGDGLYKNWSPPDGQPFIAVSNVGLYYALQQPPIVPDFMLSLGVNYPENHWEKRHRTYFVWEMGKSPELVVEIVSNLVGNELDKKFEIYARAGVSYYIVFDPAEYYGKDNLRAYIRAGDEFVRLSESYFARLHIGYTLWEGEYAGMHETWLRWTNPDGTIIPTGDEAATEARNEAVEARNELDVANLRAEKLAAALRQMGINPDEV